MIGDIIDDRVRDYSPANALEQENILAELLQHYVLASLSRARFFSRAGFRPLVRDTGSTGRASGFLNTPGRAHDDRLPARSRSGDRRWFFF